MIHYNVWFNLRNDSKEGLDIIRAFLIELCEAGDIAGFQLLENGGAAGKTRMLRFQALIEFDTDVQLAAAFSAQAARGIHAGLHGRVMALVSEFQIEVFRQIASKHCPRKIE
jgi:hypothetical protein